MKSRFLFTAGVIGMLSGVASGATAEIDYGREWNPYVTLRGGWLFGGDVKGDWVDTHPEDNRSWKKSIKNAWSGSGEFGVSCFDERISVGLELGYFTGKAAFELLPGGGGKLIFPAEFGNTFGACNVTLRHYFGERGFWYGGVGAGIARVSMTADMMMYSSADSMKIGCGANAWSFLGQGFTGLSLWLNDNWSLMVGYRLAVW